MTRRTESTVTLPWTWDPVDLKPKHRHRNLERAAALMLAELERYCDRTNGDDTKAEG